MLFPEIDLFFAHKQSFKRDLSSVKETLLFGRELGKQVPPSAILAFFGDLGSGKTTLIKGIVEGYTSVRSHNVSSPTFVTLNIYSDPDRPKKNVYHFDLYRLKDYEEFLCQGLEEYFYKEGICCIEWSERLFSYLPDCIEVHLKHTFSSLNSREIEIRAK